MVIAQQQSLLKTDTPLDNMIVQSADRENGKTLPSSAPEFIPLAQPLSIRGTMKQYQLDGLAWLIRSYDLISGCMLADDMGLGKSLQSISFLAYLKDARDITGPHLILAPKSTLAGWCNEFRKWCPDLRVRKFYGSRSQRARMVVDDKLVVDTFDVLLTTYETAVQEQLRIIPVKWCVFIVDEGNPLALSAYQRVLCSVLTKAASSLYSL